VSSTASARDVILRSLQKLHQPALCSIAGISNVLGHKLIMKTNKKQTINLGYLYIAGWNKKRPQLFGDWMRKDKEYAKEIAATRPDDIVLPPNAIYDLVIDYPLTNPFTAKIYVSPQGMSRVALVNTIVECYREIYKEENKSTKVKPGYIPGMFNHNHTDGKYGIWGHCIGDLVLHTATVKGNKITVGVDS
jgi:hypothetical protein